MQRKQSLNNSAVAVLSIILLVFAAVLCWCIVEITGVSTGLGDGGRVDKFTPFNVSIPVLDFEGDILNFNFLEDGYYTASITDSGILDFNFSVEEMFGSEEQ